MKQATLLFLIPIAFAGVGPLALAAGSKAPPPSAAVVTDATMATLNKRKVGSFTFSWTPARDANGRERKVYDILSINCEIKSASGAPLALAVGGHLHTLSGPPYSVLLSGCKCTAAVSVYTAPVAPETSRSDPVEAQRGTVFGAGC